MKRYPGRDSFPEAHLCLVQRMMGIECDLFFTFWGMDIITKTKVDNLKVVPVGNPSMHMPQMVGGFPGMTDLATNMMKKEIDKLDMPPVGEFLELISDSGAGIFACQMAAEMMHLDRDMLVDEVDDIIGAMEFLERAEGAQTLFI